MSAVPFFLWLSLKEEGESPWCFNDPLVKHTHGFSSKLGDNYKTVLSCPVLKLTYKAINIHYNGLECSERGLF